MWNELSICDSESEKKQENCDTDEDCKNKCGKLFNLERFHQSKNFISGAKSVNLIKIKAGNFSTVQFTQQSLKENQIDDDSTNLTPFSTTICKNGVCEKIFYLFYLIRKNSFKIDEMNTVFILMCIL